MSKNILDSFKKCSVFLREGINKDGVENIVYLHDAEMKAFDIIGGLFDFEGEEFFIPWGNINYLQII